MLQINVESLFFFSFFFFSFFFFFLPLRYEKERSWPLLPLEASWIWVWTSTVGIGITKVNYIQSPSKTDTICMEQLPSIYKRNSKQFKKRLRALYYKRLEHSSSYNSRSKFIGQTFKNSLERLIITLTDTSVTVPRQTYITPNEYVSSNRLVIRLVSKQKEVRMDFPWQPHPECLYSTY